MKANKIIPFVVSGLALVALPAFANTDASSKLKKLDTNADGRVSRSEFIAGKQDKIQRADTNRDGVVSADEAADIKSEKNSVWSRGDKPVSHANKADANNDGQVTQAEASAAAEASFDKMDANADGFLSVTELEAAHK
jgi:hypothetical protein